MEAMTLREILQATGGTLLGTLVDLDTPVGSVDTDSRAMTEGALFVPLVGERFDGHAYIGKSLENGAVGTLTDHELADYRPDKFYVLVPDTMLALGDLAAYYRSKFDVKIIAVTGSVGKTTCKDMTAAVLSQKFRTLKTDGNFNNNIGVPKTLFRLSREHQVAVVEMGLNHVGEIDYLTRIARPDAAIITNIGDAHIENLGSRENTLMAKAEVFHGMKATGLAILNGDDPLLRSLDGKLNQSILWYGQNDGNDYQCKNLDENFSDHMVMETVTPHGTWQQTIPGIGRYMIYPTLAAAAVGQWLGMTQEEIAEGVGHFVNSKMRMDTVRCGDGVTVLNDTYNANPQSMRAALEVLSKFDGDYKVAVLGDMLELGDLSREAHEELGRLAAESGLYCLVTYGEQAKRTAVVAAAKGVKTLHANNYREAADALLNRVQPGDALLVKASRGMALEKALEIFYAEQKDAEE